MTRRPQAKHTSSGHAGARARLYMLESPVMNRLMANNWMLRCEQPRVSVRHAPMDA